MITKIQEPQDYNDTIKRESENPTNSTEVMNQQKSVLIIDNFNFTKSQKQFVDNDGRHLIRLNNFI